MSVKSKIPHTRLWECVINAFPNEVEAYLYRLPLTDIGNSEHI